MGKVPTEAGVIDRDRAHRLAMRLGSEELLSRLMTFHPKIVRHLQSGPNAQPVILDVDT